MAPRKAINETVMPASGTELLARGEAAAAEASQITGGNIDTDDIAKLPDGAVTSVQSPDPVQGVYASLQGTQPREVIEFPYTDKSGTVTVQIIRR